MAKITYKGEEREIKITNKSMMSFEMAGGKLSEFEENPVSNSIKLVCACLGLKGDPLNYADDFPPLVELSECIRQAMDESGMTGEELEPKNDNG